jgi:S1-C subfamily serine protease
MTRELKQLFQRISWVVLIGGCAFLGGATAIVFFSRGETSGWAQPGQPGHRDLGPAIGTDPVAVSDRFEAVVKRVSPAVVYVEARKPAENPNNRKTLEESGSGVITRLEGHPHPVVLTNHHVISGAEARKIIIHLADGRVLRPARVWSDPESDVAVLGLETGDGLPVAVLGDSDKMQVGQWVLAMGSPFGLNQSVTHGIISARERGQVSLGSTIRIKEFLQTDAAINPGSSGGPLVNLHSEVIGINTAIASPSGSNSGVSFSIPSNLFRRMAGELIRNGRISRGYLGIQLSNSFEPAQALRLGLERVQGALVESVYPGSPAAQGGIRVGDVILELDTLVIKNENHLINVISSLPAGKQVTLTIWRDSRRSMLNASVGDWHQAQERLRGQQ